VVLSILFIASVALAQSTETVLHSFGGAGDGTQPVAGLYMDKTGNLYGTTETGGTGGGCGSLGCGTVFELTPNSGGWTETLIYEFRGGYDGQGPMAGLAADEEGNLYGTTSAGGHWGVGTVFELTPGSNGWAESVIHSFSGNGTSGNFPQTGVIIDKLGNLYGTTGSGGTGGACGGGCGTVYKLNHSGGRWGIKTLWNFGQNSSDGVFPEAGLTFDKAGNLYGTTFEGLTPIYGTVFELKHSQSGWTESILYHFQGGNDGGFPQASVTLDEVGDVFGTTLQGGGKGCGGAGCGTVFMLTPSGGNWTEKVLHQFGLTKRDGLGPVGSLLFNKKGVLYGTTELGGAAGLGTVFKMRQHAGAWKEAVIYNFDGPTGAVPEGGLIRDTAGNLYGTTSTGGNNFGVVFEDTP
jgi:uncharacterized repeat protein (TIGR03803 family)